MGNHFINKFFYLRTLILLTFSLFIYSCNTTEPEDKPALSFADASCTEVWLEVTGEAGKEMQLLRDGKEAVRFILQSSTQIIYDDSLTLKTEYEYQLIRTDNGVKSNFITAKTLDTTSHSFSWQKFTFGDIGSSVLYDCAIISGNNIWCVGEILIKDTSENGYSTYNAIHWNGNEWELKRITFSLRILYPNSTGDTIGIAPIKSVLALNENDIWFAAGTVQHWDGKQFQQFKGEYAGFSNKIWGNNSSNLYFVGNNGTIVHYQNGQWTKIESGTNLNINDIYGAYNKITNEYEILAVASNVLESLERDLLKISGSKITHLSTNPVSSMLSSVWFKPDVKYYLGGDGIFIKNELGETAWKNKPLDITTYYTYRIRGNGLNDIFATGGAGEVIHFNGLTWCSYFSQTKLSAGNFYGIALKDNMTIAVGQDNPQAVIAIGRR